MISAIKIEQLHKHFGGLHALKGVSLDIAQGEFFALLGPNGAGKTTLISILAGLTRADGGTVQVMGHNVVTDYRAARRLLGVVPQELAYDPFFTVRENLRIQSGYFGLRHNDDWIDEIMTNLGLMDKATTNMRALSGGMKRRVLVAQALVHKPPVIVLDEPTAGVDVSLRTSLWEFVSGLNKSGHTIILTTHYLEEAEALCNRVGILNQGQIVALDTTAELLKSSGELKLKIQIKPNQLPLGLRSYVVKEADDAYSLLIHKPAEVEGILAQLRMAGITLVDMALTKPDLEDVFLQMTSSI
ncbi:ABC transporter ATP-binding protein [Sulfuriferula nivalis]|uniref:ABC transporter ATP-binding subunit n=1 Tax=Sulfuriferula nivalis TaxID=2675298 RepID=A0A809RG66_9PROT|nr:ABC transporter ATP-binding protein [Sulfuriferula nivalis]BBP00849.1 ABC transporter ATP-binding subunit [Sulfuriferula nivalis]